jgi:uncharacterized protein involved in type VI secretion and phage assembly
MFADELERHAGRYYGKHRGRVVGNEDLDHQGTITVTVASVFGPDHVVQARACMPYGHFFVPPVDAHVWIEFEGGDPQLALWVGVWYPKDEGPVAAQVSPPDVRVIQTPAGHTIQIDDTDGEEKILIRHASDAFISIDAKGGILLSNPSGSHLHLDADGTKATLVEEHGNHLTMGAKGTSIVNPDGTTVNVSGDAVHISAGKAIVEATSVALGAGSGEPTLMGKSFSTLWDLMLTHTHPTAMGPSGPSIELQLPTMKLLPGMQLTSSVTVK